jgi:putative transposase
VVDFLKHYHRLTGLAMVQLLFWLGLSPRKFHRWKDRYGKANEPNAMIPRDHWIEPQERAAIIQFARQYPLEGCRRLTFMMLDRDVAAVSPATTYRVLKAAGLIGSRFLAHSRKGQGFVQPLQPHQHWHVDFSYVNLGGTFYYLCSVLDGASRAILAWDIRPQMREADAEIVIQRAREAHPVARPRLISDNGASVCSQRLQGIYPPLAELPRSVLALLPTEQR